MKRYELAAQFRALRRAVRDLPRTFVASLETLEARLRMAETEWRVWKEIEVGFRHGPYAGVAPLTLNLEVVASDSDALHEKARQRVAEFFGTRDHHWTMDVEAVTSMSGRTLFYVGRVCAEERMPE